MTGKNFPYAVRLGLSKTLPVDFREIHGNHLVTARPLRYWKGGVNPEFLRKR